MPLPTIETPTYELKLHSSNKKIKYRPFLVKEEKILILALESKNESEITNAVKDVLKKCILTKGVDVDKLPTFDIEYIFLNIRAKSIGEDIKMTVTCPDDGVTQVPVTLYVDEIKVIKPKNQFIENNFTTTDNSEEVVNKSFKVVADCMDTIYTEEDAWDVNDYTPSERLDFVEKLSSKQYKEVEKFFATMPKLSHTIEVINPNTTEKGSVILEGLADFFG